jgi:hypothetical protein
VFEVEEDVESCGLGSSQELINFNLIPF